MYKRINGIQHIGVGVLDSEVSQKWYRKFIGMDIPIFDGVAPAPLMDVYTHNETITKRATMILNLQGGCAMEVVNPTSFTPKKVQFEIELGDIGIYINQIKARDVRKAFEHFKTNGAKLLSEVVKMPNGEETFYAEDPNGLIFQIIPGQNFYTKGKHITGGPNGCVVGVSNIDNSLKLYADILGYDKVVYDETGVFEDYKSLEGGEKQFRRIRLTQSNPPGGGFAKVSADTYIELIQAIDYTPKKIWKGRIWGDVGFVHIGLDVRGMQALGAELDAKGFGFTCDTKDTLDMGGTTRVHCTYIDDPDGILIEMIEVYKIPIIEKLGIFLNVEKRDPLKPLPDFMLKAMRFSRIKD
ncbi:VOC family protein [Marinoscillum furvescens]|uniref:Catechol 2,3-dioxygenase-like lactoylglutathione lyase family enzyme n=1 Tax=Marinoscillum furvescens DSM 4134 TaxID=1122208 RepID=A0A3D9KX37_MARFU|nr:VOC family protein [Marinoscillum furvescens]RED92837.1 catechol 2,3-dioxygenase-like lactoylglutathione lyase family enzyme [Marinoscillum furvescens DSM 4134]